MNKLKILHIVGTLKLPKKPDEEASSGAVRAALEIARVQANRGHKVWVASVGEELWNSEWNGVQLISLKRAKWANLNLGFRSFDFSVQYPLILFVERHKFDVIQGHMYHYLRFLPAKLRIAHFHSDPLYRGLGIQEDPADNKDLKTAFNHSDVQLAVSQFVANQLKKVTRKDADVFVAYNGVNSTIFHAAKWEFQRAFIRQSWEVGENDIVLLYAGAIVAEKGVLHLARVCTHLFDHFDHVHLVLVGGAALWDQTVERLNIDRGYEFEVFAELSEGRARNRVHILGSVKAVDMPGIYAACDVVVIPSIWNESFGLVAIEALASGKPVIASNVGGLPEVSPDHCGILVLPGNESDLTRAIITLINNPDLRQRMSNAGRAHARKFSWERTAGTLETIYARYLGD